MKLILCTSQEQFLENYHCLIDKLNLDTESSDRQLSTMAQLDFHPAADECTINSTNKSEKKHISAFEFEGHYCEEIGSAVIRRFYCI